MLTLGLNTAAQSRADAETMTADGLCNVACALVRRVRESN
jgi:hypothetical protein